MQICEPKPRQTCARRRTTTLMGGVSVPFADKTLTCVDCGQQFTFTADDQEFFASRGFGEPKRCRSCRANRRNEREGGGVGSSMGYGGPRQERQLFDAVCANCGQATQV